MPRIKYKCPTCRKTIAADASKQGRAVKCPACQQPHRIPKAGGPPKIKQEVKRETSTSSPKNTSDSVPKSSSAQTERIRISCEHCQRPFAVRSSVLNSSVRCPKCGEKFVATQNAGAATLKPSAQCKSAESTRKPRPAHAEFDQAAASSSAKKDAVDPSIERRRQEKQAQAKARVAAKRNVENEAAARAAEEQRIVEAARKRQAEEEHLAKEELDRLARLQEAEAARKRREAEQRALNEREADAWFALEQAVSHSTPVDEPTSEAEPGSRIELQEWYELEDHLRPQNREETSAEGETSAKSDSAVKSESPTSKDATADQDGHRRQFELRQKDVRERRRKEQEQRDENQSEHERFSAELRRRQKEAYRELQEAREQEEREKQELELKERAVAEQSAAERKRLEAESARLQTEANEERLREAKEEAARKRAKIEAQKQADAERAQKLRDQVKRRRLAEAERLRQEQQARQQAEAEVRKRAEEEKARALAAEIARREGEERAHREAIKRQQKREQEVQREFEHFAGQVEQRTPVPDVASSDFQERLSDLYIVRAEFLKTHDAETETLNSEQADEFRRTELDRWRIERAVLRRHLERASGRESSYPRNRLGCDIGQFLSEPLQIKLLNLPIPTSVCGLRSKTAGVGLDMFLPRSSSNRDKGSRMSAKALPEALFCPQLPDEILGLMESLDDPTSDVFVGWLRESPPVLSEIPQSFLRHAEALIWLDIALTRELAFGTGLISSGLGYWEVALRMWNEMLHSQEFWSNWGSGAAALRRQLPLWTGEVIGRFARGYGQRGENVACHRLLSVLQKSPMPEEVKQSATLASLKASYY